MALIDRVHDAGRVITSLDDKVEVLRKEVQRLKDGGDPDVIVRAQVCLMENELLKLTRSMETLRVDLSRQAVEDYKKSTRFEMGLVRMGRVSLEYDYQLALARFRVQYPDLEVEEDPSKELPEDSTVPMVAEQPFDDSPPSAEE
ncbi:hypothetical protein B296_00031328 [Ensete ventricosum]|uniref:Uncharacterized protein n=1 Tax=Ensete ventricosum TaxID=4639 RepID=A0A426ZE84_ENSVE|nr:hypothetical protein B296_00031328 [Ensete ventricosum]